MKEHVIVGSQSFIYLTNDYGDEQDVALHFLPPIVVPHDVAAVASSPPKGC